MIQFKGKCQWASIPPNKPKKPYEINPQSPEDCFYSIEVECSKERFDDLMKKGLPRLSTLKEDEQGNTYLRLKATKIKGEYEFKDIPVVDKYGRAVTEKLANGSEVIAMAELAPIKGRKGVVLRLKGVQVLNLIPFTGGRDNAEAMFNFEELPAEEAINPHEQQEAHDLDNQEQDCDDIPF